MNRTCAGAGTGGRSTGIRNPKAEKGIRQDFCPACGHEIIWDDEEYCPFCGEKLEKELRPVKITKASSYGGGVIFLIILVMIVIMFLSR